MKEIKITLIFYLLLALTIKMTRGENQTAGSLVCQDKTEVKMTTKNTALQSFASLLFSHSVAFDSWQPHGLQHTRRPCSSPSPRACTNSCLSSADAIQPSHPLSSPSPPAFNLSQHQGVFQWISSSHQVAKILEVQLQHQSSQWIFRTDFL